MVVRILLHVFGCLRCFLHQLLAIASHRPRIRIVSRSIQTPKEIATRELPNEERILRRERFFPTDSLLFLDSRQACSTAQALV